jgi:LPPG:FO 2-phospho-L-lactate transferase
VLKGPTAAFMQWAGQPVSAAGVAGWYGDLLDGLIADEDLPGQLPVQRADLLMADASGRRRLASEALAFAERLRA